MLGRCRNPKDKDHHRYGQRGIRVCKRWLKFENFIKDMGKKPKGFQIERINNNGIYEPKNCKWASVKEQANNRRSTVYYVINGKRMTLKQVSEACGINYPVIKYRLRKVKWPLMQAISMPVDRGNRWKR